MRTRAASASAMRGAAATLGFGDKGMPTVLLTREKGKNEKLRKRLEERGVRVVELPCIMAQELGGAKELPKLLKDEEWEWVVVTSPEGAKIIAQAWSSAGSPPLSVAAVGSATGKVLQKEGMSDIFVPSKAHGTTLSEELPAPCKSGRILYAVSELANQDVEDLLGKRGYQVERVDAYTTLPADWTAEDKKLAEAARVVTFGSPSAAKVWAARAPVDTPIAVCIGGTSARACESLGFSNIEHPEKPGVATWAEVVFRVLERIKHDDHDDGDDGV
eukprot:CAMPEP_0197526758 /NCGR_PEP_ID=MMETSP1318-20131121/19247_1 /TAXON_ID=552666 /ORGANISM="Partenskyella glossopodia, Strain RCC365" /LENGTH=273 /DNA_ID=CAMNT_0043081079 /DNA_START=38 /DNA_END=859 /DNA_ORIENTATION=+